MFDLTNIHESFRPFFDKNLSLLVDIEKNIGDNFCPLKENIFKFARMDFKNLKYVIVGMELSPSKNLAFRIEYNYHRRKEMIVESRLSTVGISWGFGIKISKFKLSYARSAYHLAGSPNVITLTTNLGDLFSK